MSDYMKTAKAEADAYAKKRKQQALTVIEQTNAAAKAETEAAQAETAGDVRNAQRTALDALDAAAVERQVEMQNIRRAMAGWGLTESGTERGKLQGATRAASRRSATARQTRDEAVAALKTALADKTAAIEKKRVEAVTDEKHKADGDAAATREKLVKAAMTAEAKETAAREKAETEERRAEIEKQEQVMKWKREDAEKIEAAMEKERKEQEKKDKESNKKTEDDDAEALKASKQAEANRRKALGALLDDDAIVGEVYAQALTEGWSVERAIREQSNYIKYNKAIKQAKVLYDKSGFEAMMGYVAPFDLPDTFQRRLAQSLDIPYAKVHDWMVGYRNFRDSSGKVKEMDDLW